MDLAYEYDNAGNIKSIVSAIGPAGTRRAQYDALNRLTRAVGAWGTIQYGYDSVGNRQWMNDGTNHYYSYGTYNKLERWNLELRVRPRRQRGVEELDRHAVPLHLQLVGPDDLRREAHIQRRVGLVVHHCHILVQRQRGEGWPVEGAVIDNFVYRGHDTECQFSADGKSNKYIYVSGRLELRTCSSSESFAYPVDTSGSSRFVLKNSIKDSANTTSCIHIVCSRWLNWCTRRPGSIASPSPPRARTIRPVWCICSRGTTIPRWGGSTRSTWCSATPARRRPWTGILPEQPANTCRSPGKLLNFVIQAAVGALRWCGSRWCHGLYRYWRGYASRWSSHAWRNGSWRDSQELQWE